MHIVLIIIDDDGNSKTRSSFLCKLINNIATSVLSWVLWDKNAVNTACKIVCMLHNITLLGLPAALPRTHALPWHACAHTTVDKHYISSDVNPP